MKKLLILLLAAALCLGTLVSCTGTTADPGETGGAADTVEPDDTAAEETNVPVKSVTIDGADIKDFHILYSEDDGASVKTAANELGKYIKLATGLDLPVTTDASAEGKRIAITTTEEDAESFTIKSDDGGLTISGGRTRGALYGVYNFLEDELGWHFLTSDTVIIDPADGITLVDLDISYEPYFEYRDALWMDYLNPDIAVKRMINAKYYGWRPIPEELGGTYGITGTFVHTLYALSEYQDPERKQQPCLTDETVYQNTLKNVLALLEANPDAQIISVSQEDGARDQRPFCGCENCKKVLREEKSWSGYLLRFVNRIAEEVEKQYPDVKIITLAYHDTERAPKNTLPRDNVIVELCTIALCDSHPITEESCKQNVPYCRNIADWGQVCDSLYIWDYVMNNYCYSAPWPNFDEYRENFRFYAENNVKGIFALGRGEDSGEFGNLRAYLLARLMQNPYMTAEEYDEEINTFMKGYYGPGWENIRKYYDFIQTPITVDVGHASLPEEVSDMSAWRGASGELVEWFDAAIAAAEDQKTVDHIRKTRISCDYMRLSAIYEDQYTNGDDAMKEAYEAEVKALYDTVCEYDIQMYEKRNPNPVVEDFGMPPTAWYNAGRSE